jgi:hypothetical protein
MPKGRAARHNAPTLHQVQIPESAIVSMYSTMRWISQLVRGAELTEENLLAQNVVLLRHVCVSNHTPIAVKASALLASAECLFFRGIRAVGEVVESTPDVCNQYTVEELSVSRNRNRDNCPDRIIRR